MESLALGHRRRCSVISGSNNETRFLKIEKKHQFKSSEREAVKHRKILKTIHSSESKFESFITQNHKCNTPEQLDLRCQFQHPAAHSNQNVSAGYHENASDNTIMSMLSRAKSNPILQISKHFFLINYTKCVNYYRIFSCCLGIIKRLFCSCQGKIRLKIILKMKIIRDTSKKSSFKVYTDED